MTENLTGIVKDVSIQKGTTSLPSETNTVQPEFPCLEAFAILEDGKEVYLAFTPFTPEKDEGAQITDYLIQNGRYKGKTLTFKKEDGCYINVNSRNTENYSPVTN